ncbi:VPA1267 family protein [Pseudomonas sp. Eth.TT006]
MANSQENLEIFQAWVSSKSPEDFQSIVHRGALSRTEIAIQCGFAKSVLAQNPRIKRLLVELEDRLRSEGVLPIKSGIHGAGNGPDVQTGTNHHQHPTASSENTNLEPTYTSNGGGQEPTSRKLETIVRRLQSENASQRAEIQELRRQLAKLSAIQEALATTGRLPR